MKDNKTANLLWLDLEMTGLEVGRDKILEVGVIATDWDFNEIGRFEAVVKVDDDFIRSRLTGDFWEKNSTTRDVLIEQNASGQTSADVEKSLLDFINKYFSKKEAIYLAGNSIWNDRKFIEAEWPRLDQILHYRMLDVSAWKIVFENKFGYKFKKPEEHRAMGDIEGSIMELKKYLTHLDFEEKSENA